jgi:hypothetical protein
MGLVALQTALALRRKRFKEFCIATQETRLSLRPDANKRPAPNPLPALRGDLLRRRRVQVHRSGNGEDSVARQPRPGDNAG